MGIFDRARRLLDYNPTTGFTDTSVYASPWAFDSTLAAVIPPTSPAGTVTVAAALTVPPVARGIGLLSTVAAACPLGPAPGSTDAPAWVDVCSAPGGAPLRNSQLVQDLAFYGRALLLLEREGTEANPGEIVDAVRLNPTAWGVNELGEITLQGTGLALPPGSYVYIPSLLPAGFLDYGAEAVKHYRSLANSIASRGKNPVPLVNLQLTEAFDGTPEELTQARDDWAAARQSENGAVAFTPYGIKLETPGHGTATDWLLEARNAVRLDVANYLNVNAALLDGNNGTSDTYSNTLQSISEFVAFSLRTWLTPIASRLSQDDVTPEGVTLAFDTSEFDDKTSTDAAGNTGTATTPAPQEDTE